ncbi:MAG: hypothetical protein AAGC95_05850 [Pseudomonadota bacterium]
MKMMKLQALSVIATFLTVGAASANTPDLTGGEIVARATEAAGGAAWKRPKTLYFEGDMRMYADGLFSEETHVDRYVMRRILPTQSDDAHAANGMVRFDAYAKGEIVFQISFDGVDTYDRNGRVDDAVATEQWSAAFGFGIIRFADGEGFSVDRLADDQVEGRACYIVQVTDPAGKETIFGIDKEGYEIRMVGFDTPRGWHHRVYSDFDWHENPRFRQPTRVRLYYDGRKTNDIRWPVFRVNVPLDPKDFVISPR